MSSNLLKNVPKFVWYQGEKWTVIAAPKPNKTQQFLLVQREADTVEEDGKPTIEMIVLFPPDEECYPDTPHVRTLMKSREKANTQLEAALLEIEHQLDDAWLGMFQED